MHLFTKTLIAMALTLAAAETRAHGSYHGRNDRKQCSTSQKTFESSPLNYHETYAGVVSTLVTIKDVYLRTSTGAVIKVAGTEREVNLQDLSGFGKGITISLAGVTFPDNAATVDVVEVQVPIVSEQSARAVSVSGDECKLRVPKAITLYTSAPVTVIAGQDYRIGVTFTALDDIQISVLSTVKTKKCCECGPNRWRKDKEETQCESTSESKSETICKLANKRHAINKFLRPADEF